MVYRNQIDISSDNSRQNSPARLALADHLDGPSILSAAPLDYDIHLTRAVNCSIEFNLGMIDRVITEPLAAARKRQGLEAAANVA
jgi:hypothetical protein